MIEERFQQALGFPDSTRDAYVRLLESFGADQDDRALEALKIAPPKRFMLFPRGSLHYAEAVMLARALGRAGASSDRAGRALHLQTAQPDPTITGVRATSRFVGPELDPRRLKGRDSDHNPVLFSIGSGERRLDALSWNVCFRYAFNPGRGTVNNGFGRRFESIEDYRARLSRTATELEEMTRKTAPSIVLLQEAAREGEPLHGLLEQALRDRLGPLGYTVFSSGELVSAVRGPARRVDLPTGLKRQTHTMDAMFLEEQRSLVVNVHWTWSTKGSPEEEATREDLQSVVRHLRERFPGVPIFFAGDMNCRPSNAAPAEERGSRIEDVVGDLGAIVAPPGPTNVRWNGEKSESEMTFADFGVWISE